MSESDETTLFMTVALPEDMVKGLQHDDVVNRIQNLCQQAFEFAVQLEASSPRPILSADMGDVTDTETSTTLFRVPLDTTFNEALSYKPEFLRSIAKSIDVEFLYPDFAPKLQG